MHKHEHKRCSATIVYNILVIIFEIIAQLSLTHHEAWEVLNYELIVQWVHLVGIILLWATQLFLIHRLKQNSKTFMLIWSTFIFLHVVVLHILPRIIWVVYQWHWDETWEYIRIILIALVVSILFLVRDPILRYFWLKNKRNFKSI